MNRTSGKLVSIFLVFTIVISLFGNVAPVQADTQPPLPALQLLEIQPGLRYDVNDAVKSSLSSYLGGRSIEVTHMPMAEFVSKVEEVNGKYDIVYIGNNKSGGDSYSAIGAKVRTNPNVAGSYSNDVEYYNGNDITYLNAEKITDFINSKQLTIFDSTIFDSSLSATKLYKSFKDYYLNNSKYPNVKLIQISKLASKTVKQPNYPSASDYFTGYYFNSKTLPSNNNGYVLTAQYGTIDFSWGSGSPDSKKVNTDNFSARWTGSIKAEATGTYTFKANVDDGVRVYVQEQGASEWTTVINSWKSNSSSTTLTGTYDMEEDSIYNIKVEYYESTSSATAKLSWVVPEGRDRSQLAAALQAYGNTVIAKRPILNINTSPVQYEVRADGTTTIISNSTNMGFTFDMWDLNSSGSKMSARLYIDRNGDGMYRDNEQVAFYDNIGNINNYSINYTLPIGLTGVMPWKLEIADKATGARSYCTGYAAYKGKNPLNIRVLQLFSPDTPGSPGGPSGSNYLGLSSLSNFRDSDTGRTYNLLSRDGEFNITVTEMSIATFNKDYGKTTTAYRVGQKITAPTVLNGNYDMVIVGFDDAYTGDLDLNGSAMKALIDFADSGQSIMFTHDTIGFNNNNLTKAFRDRLGMNVYAHDPLPEAGKTSFGMTRLALDYNNISGYKFPDTVLTHKINESYLTQYPYVLGDIKVSPTHLQYLQLDLEDPDVVPVFTYQNEYVYNHQTRGATLASPLTPETKYHQYDGRNDYYTFTKGNLTFSGTGHSKVTALSELQMFVNTMIKASVGSNHAPTVEVTGIADGQKISKSGDNIDFTVKATDIDPLDNNLTLKAYVDMNGNGSFEDNELKSIYVDKNNDNTFSSDENASSTSISNVTSYKVRLVKDAPMKSLDQLKLKIQVLDNSGAEGKAEINLSQVSVPVLELKQPILENGYLPGDIINIPLVVAAGTIDYSTGLRNIKLQMTMDDTAFEVVSADGWTRSGSTYSAALPDLDYRPAPSWPDGKTTKNIVIKVKKQEAFNISNAIAFDYLVDNTHVTQVPTSYQINVNPGIINVQVKDTKGRGINNVPIEIKRISDGSIIQTKTGVSGSYQGSGNSSGKYEVTIQPPSGYGTLSGQTTTLTAELTYSDGGNGEMFSFTLSGEQIEDPRITSNTDPAKDSVDVKVNGTAQGKLYFDLNRPAEYVRFKLDTNINSLTLTALEIRKDNQAQAINPPFTITQQNTTDPNNNIIYVQAPANLSAGIYELVFNVNVGSEVTLRNGYYYLKILEVEAKEPNVSGEPNRYGSDRPLTINVVKLGAPTLTANPTEPTSGNVVVTATGPNDADFDSIYYRIGGSAEDTSTGFVLYNPDSKITLTENSVVYAKCRDKYGNYSDVASITVDNINVYAEVTDSSITAGDGKSKSTSVIQNGKFNAIVKFKVQNAGIVNLELYCPEGSEELFDNMTVADISLNNAYHVTRGDSAKKFVLTSNSRVEKPADNAYITIKISFDVEDAPQNSGTSSYELRLKRPGTSDDVLNVQVVELPKIL